MDFFEAVGRRASVRDLVAVDVPDGDLEQILDAGRRAPSGRNVQPLHFIVVRDPATIAQLSEGQGCLGDVSLIIMIVGRPDDSAFWLEDVAAAAENMLLAITALDYASVWIEGTLLRQEDRWKALLGVPDEMRLMIALPVGKPAGTPSQAPKRSLSEAVSYEKYGRCK